MPALRTQIAEITPVLAAEEFSQYALAKLTKETGLQHESLTKLIAESAKVAHRFCDPDAEARKRLGYVEGTQLALAIAMNNDAEDSIWSLIVQQAILRPTLCDQLALSGYRFSCAFWPLPLLLGFARHSP